ncbi:hypothetical protein Tco_0958976 [Tanacetum coccineum]
MIQGSVMASKPKKMQDAIEFATKLMDQKICTFADRQAENKRKLDDNSRSNQNQQQPFKKQNVARAYTARPGEKKVYGGSKPLCPKCNYHHDGQCAPKCNNCKKLVHLLMTKKTSLLAIQTIQKPLSAKSTKAFTHKGFNDPVPHLGESPFESRRIKDQSQMMHRFMNYIKLIGRSEPFTLALSSIDDIYSLTIKGPEVSTQISNASKIGSYHQTEYFNRRKTS